MLREEGERRRVELEDLRKHTREVFFCITFKTRVE